MTFEKAKVHIKTVDDHNKKEGEKTDKEHVKLNSAIKDLREMYANKDPDVRKALREAILEFGKDRNAQIDLFKQIVGESYRLNLMQMDFLGIKEMLGKEKLINNEQNTLAMRIGVKDYLVDGFQYRGVARLSPNLDTGKPELDIKIRAVSVDAPQEHNRNIRGIKLNENENFYTQIKAEVDKIKAEPGMSDIFD